jgi:hypothetical protein
MAGAQPARGQSRSLGSRLRWPAGAAPAADGGPDVIPVCQRASRQRSHDRVSDVVLRPHHRQVKRGTAGGRIVASQLPNKSPWPNPMEPKWVHGTRVVSEADRLLSAAAQEARVCTSYGCRCDREAHLVIPKKVA